MPGFFIMKKIHYSNIKVGKEYTIIRTNKGGYDRIYNVDHEEAEYVKLFFRNSSANQNWFDKNRTKGSNTLMANVRDKIAPHLADDERYHGGIFPYCDSEKLIVDMVEFWLKENYPEYINMSRPKRGVIAVKSR